MMSEQFGRARALFLEALELPEADRSKFVADRCAGDPALQKEIQDLLAAYVPTVETDAVIRSIGTGDQIPASLKTAGANPAAKTAAQTPIINESRRQYSAGTLIADRYRIVDRLGEGGMGEVFRAEDTTLNQTVALKFLPLAFAKSPAWIARFRQEARLARTVTHPNVCRIFDLVESGGECFLSMEYVEGEDLAALYRRIGRLPIERAIAVSRQICLGLAVAHQHNVIHRDLKPQNIMLDGNGNVRITDFGIAALAGEIQPSEIRTGTAAYMAPEQITGRGVSIQSDIYSLGLVMFELFTGRRAFQAETIDEYADLHVNAAPPSPSQMNPEMPRDVEQIILQCLEKEPSARPASALIVAASLPGTNVLSDVLAAHLTPSPSMVAVSRVSAPTMSGVVMVGLAALLSLTTWWFRSKTINSWDHLGEKSPRVMRERARTTQESLVPERAQLFDAFGYCDRHETEEFVGRYPPFSETNELTLGEGRGPVFWYREGMNPFLPQNVSNVIFNNGRATLFDPPTEMGSSTSFYDLEGKLIAFVARPIVQSEATVESNPLPKFQPFVRAAGFDGAAGSPQSSGLDPAKSGFQAFGWTKSKTNENEIPMTAVGIALHDQPIVFATITYNASSAPSVWTSFIRRREVVSIGESALFLAVMAAAFPWAWRGYWSGRIDRDGAVRLGLAVFTLNIVPFFLTLGNSGGLGREVSRLATAIIGALGEAAAVAILFVVVDLYARRYWPDILITWNRAIRCHLGDIDVRRHVAAGVFVGCLWALLAATERMIADWMGWPPLPFLFGDRIAEKVYGLRDAMASSVASASNAMTLGMMFLLLLVLLRIFTRNAKAAMVITGFILVPIIIPRGAHGLLSWLFLGVGGIGIFLWLMTTCGLLSVVVALIVTGVLNTTPLTTSLDSWYADVTILSVGLIAILALYGLTGDFAKNRAPTALVRS